MRTVIAATLTLLLVVAGSAPADAVTIYDIQYSGPPDYVSPLVGDTLTVTGGIVTKVVPSYWTKVVIQDPSLGPEWAGIIVTVDPSATAPACSTGYQVDFIDVVVEESRGNTQLYYGPASSCVVNSTGHTVDPLVVSTADIPYPINPDLSERYEHMLLTVEDVVVGAMDLGKASDNYELNNAEGTCWASDYTNVDLPPGSLYYVSPGQCFASVTGYLEQYQKESAGWDYYQLLPRWAEDYVVGPSATDAVSWSGVKALFR